MRLLIFTYAPAGLGHLRVTDALVHTRPEGYNYIVLGSSDKLISIAHRITSINPLARKIFEASQYGVFEDVITLFYVWALRRRSEEIYIKLLETIGKYRDLESVTVVATHPSLANQIGEVKEKIRQKTGLMINLVVQVTDDSSQHIWVVKDADLTMVPSRLTRDELIKYAASRKIKFNCEVSPYPVSPILGEELSRKQGSRQVAFQKGESDAINVLVPISGAAVGLRYLADLMLQMDRIYSRFHFLVVAKRSVFTKNFLKELGQLRQFELFTGRSDKEVVDIYEKVYKDYLIHLEITKPSEQTFKCLLPPNKVGGAILLLSQPVGRQEFDNIEFLKRHKMLLSPDENGELTVESLKDKSPRAVKLPKDVMSASKLISSCLNKGIFEEMTKPDFNYQPESYMTSEIGDNGVWLFWEKLKIAGML